MNHLKERIDTIPPNIPQMYHRVPAFLPLKGIAAMRLVFGGFFLDLDSVPNCSLRRNARLGTDGVQAMQSPGAGGGEPGRAAGAWWRGVSCAGGDCL